jgi:hypothetical protein
MLDDFTVRSIGMLRSPAGITTGNGDAMPNQVPQSDCEEMLRPKVCPVCDYSLAGSPAVGICPECGRPYDTARIYLYGSALGYQRKAWNMQFRRTSQMVWAGVWMVVVLTLILWPHGLRVFSDPLPLFLIGTFALRYALSIWRGLSDQGSGVVQVKLTPIGVRQGTRGIGPFPYESNDKAKLVPWRRVKEVYLGWIGSYGVIRISNERGFWKTNLYREFVHANFACSESEFVELQRRVRNWLATNDCAAALKYMDTTPHR